MPASLTQALFEAGTRDAPAPGPGGAMRAPLRPHHAVLGESAGLLALAALERAGAARCAIEAALFSSDRRPLHAGFELADVLAAARERSHRLGIHFAAPGSGSAARAYVARLAAPGKIVACAGTSAAVAGAYGALALGVDAVEAAAAIGGGAIDGRIAGVLRVQLEGVPATGVAGDDVAVAIANLLRGAPAGLVIEFGGSGVESLSMRDRHRLCLASLRLGARAALFPSDEVTRAALRAHGREADWRAIPSPEPPADARVLRLEDIEPMIASAESLDEARRVLDWAGTPVARVWIGAAALPEEIARLCERLETLRAAPSVRAWLDPDGRSALEQMDADGVLARLAAAGIEVETERPQRASEVVDGVSLATGIVAEEAAGWKLASLETCALAIRDGKIGDPREEREWAGRPLLSTPVASDGRFHVAPREPAAAPPAKAAPSFPLGEPLDGPLRGPLLCRAEALPAALILPWGARMLPEEGDVAAFSRHALEGEAPGFAEKARAAGASFVAARGELGRSGGEPERAALALGALGVRATFASAYDPAFHARLVRAGVLPLRFLRESDAAAFEAGDELEIPGVPDALAEAQPIPVRNLTRGLQCLVSHDLDAYALAVVRDGGLLAHARLDFEGARA